MEYEELDLTEFDTESDGWETSPQEERTAFLAALVRQGESEEESAASLKELERLADTAGIMVLGQYSQKRNNPERASYFGKGWLQEIAAKMHSAGADYLIVNEELSPIQARNIEKDYSIAVMDRTEVILSIFHDHARTREARLQVRLAELQYKLPRLRRLWGHFDKERGSVRSVGGAATRGMGEKQIEIDKRLIRVQIRQITRAIDAITHQKITQRKQREKTLKLCLVGYTNAGKSTLFNTLTSAGVLVEDKLFATLDSTSRQFKLSTGQPIVISDTVGFISKLPHHLVASFRATLMEVLDADLLLHVVDASDDRFQYYITQVDDVLGQIGALEIKQLLVLNKADLLDDKYLALLNRQYPQAVLISAKDNDNTQSLLMRVENVLLDNRRVKMFLPYSQGALVSRLHEIAVVHSEDYQAEGTALEVTISGRDIHHFRDFLVE